ncbi:hypothetical protein VOLCADRAFT_107281 [Volvox carteri f. nagariensis]|uniref:Uncharacterized protein n=1 Tax=Volvox carteri f. nagariensis TaxID=3068 RepID=D8UCY5_VOLCA|nr:uncharacterized protein VOLCADRAFT_107281 [Volvox carteri f. nagariensis]EFJ42470.1 hypothetical protein VOLCADRAFT_107281 [Volvox carteri f. nagariensis]|eukprot:XP_002956533.1 hypothetical protein VOLCADRAFT_107281 [Volvox carteri f. nagariensis]
MGKRKLSKHRFIDKLPAIPAAFASEVQFSAPKAITNYFSKLPEGTPLPAPAPPPAPIPIAPKRGPGRPRKPRTAPARLLPLPFRHYRFVTSTGAPAERRRRHPFGLTRALYSDTDLPPSQVGDTAIWAEPLEMGFRWRQSAGEVHVMATQTAVLRACVGYVLSQIPPGVTVAAVTARGSKGSSNISSNERSAGPSRSFATGVVAVTLVKMHPADGASSDGWWRRCLEGAPVVAWEEVSERDYSTLPPERLEELRRQQARLDLEARDGGGGGDGGGDGKQ